MHPAHCRKARENALASAYCSAAAMCVTGSCVFRSNWQASSWRVRLTSTWKLLPSASSRRRSVRWLMPNCRATASAVPWPLSNIWCSTSSTCSPRLSGPVACACCSACVSAWWRSGSAPSIGRASQCRREDQAGDLGIEVQRRAEQLAVGRGARRSTVRELHRQGHEGGPAKTLQDAVPDGQRHVVDELGARREMPVHRIAEHRGIGLGLQQQRRRAAVVQLQVQQQAAQRRTDIGRMAHEFAQRSQAVEVEALADQQREMRAVRQTGAFGEQPSGHFERQPRIRIPEQRQRARPRASKAVCGRASKSCSTCGMARIGPMRMSPASLCAKAAASCGGRRGPAKRVFSTGGPVVVMVMAGIAWCKHNGDARVAAPPVTKGSP